MKALITAALLLSATVASAEAKAPKPVICMQWSPNMIHLDGKVDAIICLDGKRPALLMRPSFLTLENADGEAVRIAIGWRQ